MLNKKNVPLYIALVIPVLMILLVTAFVYIPKKFVDPKYSFTVSLMAEIILMTDILFAEVS